MTNERHSKMTSKSGTSVPTVPQCNNDNVDDNRPTNSNSITTSRPQRHVIRRRAFHPGHCLRHRAVVRSYPSPLSQIPFLSLWFIVLVLLTLFQMRSFIYNLAFTPSSTETSVKSKVLLQSAAPPKQSSPLTFHHNHKSMCCYNEPSDDNRALAKGSRVSDTDLSLDCVDRNFFFNQNKNSLWKSQSKNNAEEKYPNPITWQSSRILPILQIRGKRRESWFHELMNEGSCPYDDNDDDNGEKKMKKTSMSAICPKTNWMDAR